jgi:hypothetical protein
MLHERMKTAIVGAWMLAWSVIALSVDVNTASGWIVLVASGVLPPLMLLRLWQTPTPTMSESIRDVLK